MEKAKIRPLATPIPLNRSSQKLADVITSWTAPGMQNFVAIGSGISVPQIRDFAEVLWWLFNMFVFWGSSIRLQPTPLDRYLRKMTSFRVRKCLLGVPMTIFHIWTLKFPKKLPFRGPIWLDNVKPESMRMPRSLTNVGAGNTVSSMLNAISAVVVFDLRRPIVKCWHLLMDIGSCHALLQLYSISRFFLKAISSVL